MAYQRFEFIEYSPDHTLLSNDIEGINLQELLKCFAAKETLSYEEIVGAYVKRKTRRAHDILHVQKNGPYPEYNCGNDPSFVAIVVDENGDRVKYPPLPTY